MHGQQMARGAVLGTTAIPVGWSCPQSDHHLDVLKGIRQKSEEVSQLIGSLLVFLLDDIKHVPFGADDIVPSFQPEAELINVASRRVASSHCGRDSATHAGVQHTVHVAERVLAITVVEHS